MFYSYISWLWYVGYDDLISMSNVFGYCFNNSYLFACLVACLYEDECIWWIPPFDFSSMFCLFFCISLFLYFVIILSPLYLYISYKVMFSIFLSSSILTFSLTLFLFLSFFLSLFQSVSFLTCDSFSFSFSYSFTLYHCQSLNDIAWFDMIYCILWYYIW